MFLNPEQVAYVEKMRTLRQQRIEAREEVARIENEIGANVPLCPLNHHRFTGHCVGCDQYFEWGRD